MRRILVAALLLPALVVAGCSGADAQKARDLLAQSNAASANVRSISFAVRMWTSGGPAGTEMSFLMHGGGYNKGKHKGDSVMTMSGLPGVGDVTMAVRGGHLYVKAGSRQWTEMPMPSYAQNASVFAGFDITKYVTDVRVAEGVVLGGESMSRITGVVDGGSAVKDMFSRLGAAGAGSIPSQVGDAFGDIRAVIYISDATHLPMRALIDMPIHVAGEKITIHMDMAVTAVNKPVKLPRI
jgi:hypothetical protein